MMRYLVIFLVAAFSTALAGDLKKIDLTISGMHCDHCTDKVKSALKNVKDVEGVEVDLKKGTAEVALVSNSTVSTELLASAIAEAGFETSYKEGDETKTVAASKTHHEDADCKDEAGMKGCCMEKGSKTKVIKKK